MNTLLKIILASLLFLLNLNSFAESKLDCLHGVCIGENLFELEVVEWVPVEEPLALIQKYKILTKETPIEEMYYEVNEIFELDQKAKLDLAPYIIDLQRFDQSVIDKLKRTQYFCTSMTLVGEIKTKSEDKDEHVWVTAKIIPDESGKGLFRIVQLEKNYSLMPSFLRPADKEPLAELKKQIIKEYPDVKIVRNVDRIRGAGYELTLAKYIFGFRFLTDNNVPATLRIRDTADIEPIEYSPMINKKCNQE